MVTNTRLLQKRSKRGEALVLTIAVIGLAIIVTAAGFLLAARTGQDTERVASAKVDIATREDALIREILQQTAQGMLPGTSAPGGVNWTTIMTNAVNQLEATSYVDPTEVNMLLGPNAAIPANTGDTGGLSLAIFQGYQQEIPWGGTTGLANLINAANTTSVQPPKLVWVSNANISATAAATNPQPFFLGSQMSASGTSTTSSSGRWTSIPYPNVRFGLMRPGDSMVARRVWWRIPVLYQTAQPTVEAPGTPRFPAAPANYILSLYEIPSQLPITGNANIQLGLNSDGSSWGNTTVSAGNQVQITGSIYGDAVQLSGGTYSGGISSRRQVNIARSSSVAGETFADNTYNDLGVRETKDLTRSTSLANIGAAPVSVAGDNGKVLLMPLLPGQDFYLPAAGSYFPSPTPTAWDLYARPYFHCRIRIMISGTISDPNADPKNLFNYSGGQINTTGNTGAITVKVSYLPDTSGLPDAVFGVPDSPAWTTKTYQQTNNLGGTGIIFGGNGILQDGNHVNSGFLIYTSTNTGIPAMDSNILEIDLLKMYSTLGLNSSQCYSIYIGCAPSQSPNNKAPQNLGVVIMDADNLSAFTNGLSIVTLQRLYLTGSFNTIGVPTSLYATDLRYGIDGIPAQLNLTGQVSISQVTQNSSTPVNPLSFVNAANTAIIGAGNTYKLKAITNPKALPPITRLNLLFTVEKERTN